MVSRDILHYQHVFCETTLLLSRRTPHNIVYDRGASLLTPRSFDGSVYAPKATPDRVWQMEDQKTTRVTSAREPRAMERTRSIKAREATLATSLWETV